MKLIRLLANLGYGSRRDVQRMIRGGLVTDSDGRVLHERDFPAPEQIRFRGEPLDPPSPMVLVVDKPAGYTCSADDPGAVVYDLLPERFAHRRPALNPVGRLDKDTTGLLLMTDDGKWLHRVIHPKSACHKVYRATLDRPLLGHEAEQFASGRLILHGESKPLLPAGFRQRGSHEALVMLQEGRYHQVRRMFAAVGNHVLDLRRISIGGLELPQDLEPGGWRLLTPDEQERVFSVSCDLEQFD